jgi:hypothetical protein
MELELRDILIFNLRIFYLNYVYIQQLLNAC